MTQELFIYIDDSGVLHRRSADKFFVYAGYVFLTRHERDQALARFRAAAAPFQTGRCQHEIKACSLSPLRRQHLLLPFADYESFSCAVEISQLSNVILKRKLCVHRYKDYCLKRAIKAKLRDLIRHLQIDPACKTTLHFYIDQQYSSTDRVYNLAESLREELRHGIANHDYGVLLPPLFTGKLHLDVEFCDSERTPLVQASDVLANLVFHQHHSQGPDARRLNHLETRLPAN